VVIVGWRIVAGMEVGVAVGVVLEGMVEVLAI
jgi:hypothetical protein